MNTAWKKRLIWRKKQESEIGVHNGEETPVSTGTVKETYNVDIATAADHALQRKLKVKSSMIE
jgi:amino acid transporter